MASGVPVVVSNTTSLPEICGEAGNYINPNKPEEIAAVIDELLKNKGLYDQKRGKGIERARLFSWENAAEKILNHLESINKN